MKSIYITQELATAWEVWVVEVPDEAPDDPTELLGWVQENPEELDWVCLEESGNEGSEFVQVEVY